MRTSCAKPAEMSAFRAELQALGKGTLHLADGGDGNSISVGGAIDDAA